MRWSGLALLLFAGCSPFALLDATVPTSGYRLSRNLAYGVDRRQKLDVYQPTSCRGPADIVIFFYGGNWQTGEKSEYRFVGQALASQGFLTIVPDLRFYPQVTFPAFVEDGAAVVRWAHDHATEFGGNESNLFLIGHSSGAHIAALLTLDPHYLQAAGMKRDAIRGTVGLSGPYDFSLPPYDRPVFNLPPGQPRPPPSAQPIDQVDGHAPPMLLIQGTGDTVVDPANTKRLAQRIEDAGGSVRAVYYRQLGHPEMALSLAWSFRWLAPTLHEITSFIRAVERPDVSVTPL